MPSSSVAWDINESVAIVTVNRPEARNALTWEMYDAIVEACDRAEADRDVRVLIIRGSGGAFAAGTDIKQFRDFADGEDGVAYERRLDAVIDRIEELTIATIAEIDGAAAGGGCAIAIACDLRICSERARFGVPVSRTLGNCLSMNNYSLLLQHLGPARTLDMLLRARLFTGEEAAAAGFVAELCEDDELDATADGVVQTLLGHAPLSMWAAKEAVRRIRRASIPNGDDIVARVFGSEDFHTAVAAFAAKQPVVWQGR